MNGWLSRRALMRRAVLGGAVLGGVALGACACSVPQNNVVATATLDGRRVLQDGEAIVAALQAALAIPGVAALLGADLVVAETALAAAGAVMAELDALLGGGNGSAGINMPRVQSLVSTLLDDAQTVLRFLRTPAAATAAPTRLQLLIAAAATLVPLVRKAAGLALTATVPAAMSEADALRIARGA